jgi:hypothetical protein
MVYCDGKKWNSKEYSCVKDGASCVEGKCVNPDENKKKCTEYGDVGINYELKGGIDYTTEYGFIDSREDYCVNEYLLIEYYCEGKENKFTDTYSCNTLGKKCVYGACQ